MRVAYIVETFPKRSETFVAAEAAAVAAAGHDVGIFAWHCEGGPDPAVHYGSRRSAIRRVRSPWRTARGALRAVRLARSPRQSAVAVVYAAALHDELATFGPDVIHAHFASAPTAVALVAGAALGVPVTATFHANDYLVAVSAAELRSRVRALAGTFAISTAGRTEIADRAGVDETSIRIARAAIAPSVLATLELPIEGGPPLHLVSVGRLVAKKGHRELIAGLAVFRAAHPAVDMSLEIVGDGPLRAELGELAARLGVDDVVTLSGALNHEQTVTAIVRANAAALICVVAETGDVDGIPVFLMEAVAAGRPVLTTAVGGIGDLVQDGITGVVLAATGPDEVSAGLARLVEPGTAAMARAGRSRIVAEFHPDVQVARLSEGWSAARTEGRR